MNEQTHRIVGDQIYLEPLCEDDFEKYEKVYTDPELIRYVCQPLSKDELKKSFNYLIKKQKTSIQPILTFKIIKKQTNDFAGFIGLKWNQKKTDRAELGLMLLAKFHKTNLSKIVMTAIIHYSFNDLKLNELIALCEVDNIAGNRVLKKHGFRIEIQKQQNKRKKNFWIKSQK